MRYMPTLQGREQYRDLHWALLAAIVLHGALRLVRPLLHDVVAADGAMAHLLVVPIGSLLLGYGM